MNSSIIIILLIIIIIIIIIKNNTSYNDTLITIAKKITTHFKCHYTEIHGFLPGRLLKNEVFHE